MEQRFPISPTSLLSDLVRTDPLREIEDGIDTEVLLVIRPGVGEDHFHAVALLHSRRNLLQRFVGMGGDVVGLARHHLSRGGCDGDVRGPYIVDVRSVENRVGRRVQCQDVVTGGFCLFSEHEKHRIPTPRPSIDRGRPRNHGVELVGVLEHAESALCASLQESGRVQRAFFRVWCESRVAVAQGRAVVLASAAEDDERLRAGPSPGCLTDPQDHGQDVVEVCLIVRDVLGARHDDTDGRQGSQKRRRVGGGPYDWDDFFANQVRYASLASDESVCGPACLCECSADCVADSTVGTRYEDGRGGRHTEGEGRLQV